MGSQSEALWAGITAASLGQQHGEDDWTEDIPDKYDTSRANTPVTRVEEADVQLCNLPPGVDSADDRVRTPPVPINGTSNDGIFERHIVFLHGFDEEKTNILREHLDGHGACVVHGDQLKNFSSDDLRRGYLVVPHDAEVDLKALPDRAGSAMNLVTNWWVERCLYGKCLFDPADHILSKPFGRPSISGEFLSFRTFFSEALTYSGFSSLTINSTGFVGIELLHVTKLVTLMGTGMNSLAYIWSDSFHRSYV